MDVLIVLVVMIGVLRGVTTGAVRQVVSLLGTIVAIVLGLELMHVVGGIVGAVLGAGELIQPALGFIIVFAVLQIVLLIASRLLEAVLKALKLNPLNRVAGAVLGGLKAVLILSVVLLMLGFFDMPDPENREASVLYEPVAAVFPATWDHVARYLPYMQELSDKFGREIEEVLRADAPEEPNESDEENEP